LTALMALDWSRRQLISAPGRKRRENRRRYRGGHQRPAQVVADDIDTSADRPKD
jgi:hypothetical protein